MPSKKTNAEYIEEAKKIHGDRYDYSKTVYNGTSNKVTVICPEHGEFEINASSHLKGYGCPYHSGLKKLDTYEFIRRAIETHGNRYDYSKSVYDGKRKKVTITCEIHGDFEQLPMNHIRGQGCPVCGKKYARTYNVDNHGGCLKCYANKSTAEDEIFSFIKDIYNGEVSQRNRSILESKELDIYIPELKLGIEYNGLYWHSEANKDKNSHLQKLEMCNKKGIRLIQIFEDEYISRKDIVLSKIRHLIGCENPNKIYGRKCTVSEIDFHTARDFLENNHIQGSVRSTVYLGAYYNGTLVGVMSFKKENKEGHWELTRFASIIGYTCCGVGGKLFKYFKTHYNPNEVKSFADRRWTINEEKNIYLELGFKKVYYTYPDYKYFFRDNGKRYHKFSFRKKILIKKYNLDENLTETQMTDKINAYKVYDCGLIKYVWKKE